MPRVFNRDDIRLAEIEFGGRQLLISEDPTFYVWDPLSAAQELDKIGSDGSVRLSTPAEEICAENSLRRPYTESEIPFREYPEEDGFRRVREFRKIGGILTDIVVVKCGEMQKTKHKKSLYLDWPPDLTVIYDIPKSFVKSRKIHHNIALRSVRYRKEKGNVLVVTSDKVFDIPNLFWKTASYYNPEDLDFETGLPKRLNLTTGEFVFGSKHDWGNHGIGSGYIIVHHDGSIGTKIFYTCERIPNTVLYPQGEVVEMYKMGNDLACRVVFELPNREDTDLQSIYRHVTMYNAELRKHYKNLQKK